MGFFEHLQESISQNTGYWLAGSISGLAGLVLLHKVFSSPPQPVNARQKITRKVREDERDIVILYATGSKGMYTPSISPPCEKLLNYLRMARVPFKVTEKLAFSSKGKVPWIEYNGVSVADSSYCIDFLNETLKINLNRNLTPEQAAIGRAYQRMLEEATYWCIVYKRWFISDMTEVDYMLREVPSFMRYFIKRMLIKGVLQQVWSQGTGRHTPEEVDSIAWRDFSAVSQYLGSKKFFFGDEPCEFDCTIFAFMAAANWQFRGWRITGQIKRELPNIAAYCERMKDLLYPDWEECIALKD